MLLWICLLGLVLIMDRTLLILIVSGLNVTWILKERIKLRYGVVMRRLLLCRIINLVAMIWWCVGLVLHSLRLVLIMLILLIRSRMMMVFRGHLFVKELLVHWLYLWIKIMIGLVLDSLNGLLWL